MINNLQLITVTKITLSYLWPIWLDIILRKTLFHVMLLTFLRDLS